MSVELIVRLPNHLGDACMSLPALELLAARGHAPTLAGRPWAADLFAGYPWPILRLPRERRARLAALRAAVRPGTAALLLTNSIGSALDFRLVRLRSTGYGTDARRLLLSRAIAVPERWRRSDAPMHMVEYYYELARAFVGGDVNLAGIKWIASFPGNIDSRIDRYSDISILQGRRVIDPVANHSHPPALLLQLGNFLVLVFGQHFGKVPVDAQLARYRASNRFSVTS